jgi:hypothetical protein
MNNGENNEANQKKILKVYEAILASKTIVQLSGTLAKKIGNKNIFYYHPDETIKSITDFREESGGKLLKKEFIKNNYHVPTALKLYQELSELKNDKYEINALKLIKERFDGFILSENTIKKNDLVHDTKRIRKLIASKLHDVTELIKQGNHAKLKLRQAPEETKKMIPIIAQELLKKSLNTQKTILPLSVVEEFIASRLHNVTTLIKQGDHVALKLRQQSEETKKMIGVLTYELLKKSLNTQKIIHSLSAIKEEKEEDTEEKVWRQEDLLPDDGLKLPKELSNKNYYKQLISSAQSRDLKANSKLSTKLGKAKQNIINAYNNKGTTLEDFYEKLFGSAKWNQMSLQDKKIVEDGLKALKSNFPNGISYTTNLDTIEDKPIRDLIKMVAYILTLGIAYIVLKGIDKLGKTDYASLHSTKKENIKKFQSFVVKNINPRQIAR